MAPARRGRFGFLCLREAVFCCARCLVYLPLRWHPRCDVCCSSVAPVRGGTYFSLPPQRKVGKRKRLTPPGPCSYPRALNVPTLHTAVPWLVLVANASNERLTRFEYPYSGKQQRMVCAAQVANCV